MKALRDEPIAVPWFGIAREDWRLVPLRYLVRFLSGGTPDKGNPDFWAAGTVPWVSPKDMKVDRISDSEDHITVAALDGSATQLVPVGSVLVVVRGMILAHTLPVSVTTGPVTINQDIKALVCGERILPEFLQAVLAGQMDWLVTQADSSAHGTKKLETEVLQRFEVPCPPLDVQRRIVATMRAQAMGLDEVVAAKQRVLNLLTEKRRALIATAVTRGLDPRVKLRDSGVSWLGEIPAYWETERVRWLFRERDQRGNPELPLMEVSIANGVTVRAFSKDRIETTAADFNTYKIARKNDVVFNKMRMWQGAVGISPTDGLVSPDYVVSAAVSKVVPEYAGLMFRTSEFSAECGRRSHGLTWDRLRIYWDEFRDIEISLPPTSEQFDIVEYVVRETTKLDAVRAATERTVALLHERRSALAAAVMAGQLDDWATA